MPPELFLSKRVCLVNKSSKINIALRRRSFFFVGMGLEISVHLQAGAGGDELADDDVFLQAHQMIHLALDGGVGEDLGGLLKEAADRKLSVAREALVMPMSIWV